MYKRDVILFLGFVCILLLIFPPHMIAYNASAEVMAVPHASAEIVEFSINPTSACQYQDVDFIVTVANRGNTLILPRVQIDIFDPYNTTMATLNLESPDTYIIEGERQDFIASWNTGDLFSGTYTARAVVHYEDKSTSEELRTFFIISRPTPPAPSTPPITPPREAWMRFTRLPVLQEVRPGETVVTSVRVEIPSSKDVKMEVSGIPQHWIDVIPTPFLPYLQKSKSWSMIITVPSYVEPGDYMVTYTVSGEGIKGENLFILRVKPYSPGYDKPSIVRTVNIDKDKGNTLVSIRVKNSGNVVDRLEVIEDVPKSIVWSADQIKFGTSPAKILTSDPVIKWVLDDLDPYETRTISYEVPVVLGEYSPYVYWPVSQMNVIYKKPPELIKILGMSTPYLAAGKTGEVSVTLTNQDTKPVDIAAKLELPANWGITPDKIVTTLPPMESNTLIFFVMPPVYTASGTYTITLRAPYDTQELVRDNTVVVLGPSIYRFLQAYSFLLLVPAVVIIGIVLMKWRPARAGQRKGGVSLLRLKQEMEEK